MDFIIYRHVQARHEGILTNAFENIPFNYFIRG